MSPTRARIAPRQGAEEASEAAFGSCKPAEDQPNSWETVENLGWLMPPGTAQGRGRANQRSRVITRITSGTAIPGIPYATPATRGGGSKACGDDWRAYQPTSSPSRSPRRWLKS